MPKIGTKTIQYSVYGKKNGVLTFLKDTTNCQLPSIEFGTDAIKGAGILGEIDLPSFFNPGSMTFGLGFRVSGEDGAVFSAPKLQEFEVRWVTDKFDSANISVGIDAHKAVIKCLPKKFDPGKIETGSPQDGSNEYEVVYYKEILNGKVIIEIDKLNSVFIVNGVDYAKQIMSAL